MWGFFKLRTMLQIFLVSLFIQGIVAAYLIPQRASRPQVWWSQYAADSRPAEIQGHVESNGFEGGIRPKDKYRTKWTAENSQWNRDYDGWENSHSRLFQKLDGIRWYDKPNVVNKGSNAGSDYHYQDSGVVTWGDKQYQDNGVNAWYDKPIQNHHNNNKGSYSRNDKQYPNEGRNSWADYQYHDTGVNSWTNKQNPASSTDTGLNSWTGSQKQNKGSSSSGEDGPNKGYNPRREIQDRNRGLNSWVDGVNKESNSRGDNQSKGSNSFEDNQVNNKDSNSRGDNYREDNQYKNKDNPNYGLNSRVDGINKESNSRGSNQSKGLNSFEDNQIQNKDSNSLGDNYRRDNQYKNKDNPNYDNPNKGSNLGNGNQLQSIIYKSSEQYRKKPTHSGASGGKNSGGSWAEGQYQDSLGEKEYPDIGTHSFADKPSKDAEIDYNGDGQRGGKTEEPCRCDRSLIERLQDLEKKVNEMYLERDKLTTKLWSLEKGSQQQQSSKQERQIVSFSAEASKNLPYLTESERIKFDEVLVNNGAAYDPKTGVFRAPVTGVYLFSATILSGYNATIETMITLNGQEACRLYSGGFENRGSGTNTVILNLRKGDEVAVNVFYKNGNYVHGKWSSFSGTLLETY